MGKQDTPRSSNRGYRSVLTDDVIDCVVDNLSLVNRVPFAIPVEVFSNIVEAKLKGQIRSATITRKVMSELFDLKIITQCPNGIEGRKEKCIEEECIYVNHIVVL
eukprot:TRINITY_DN240_c0_g1_i3.p2 TRINITY_DN240_c0_g1~~TRINITY_DN240_c0_g1_i3.p2  ORF type:complete len:105 (+),score=23.91 TRINITY_DN240_c0_g1_i3:511-825(+)